MAKFSVIVPAYNADTTLSQTLDAILAQRHVEWECVVVDDGSTDTTLAMARDYARRDPRIRVVSQENQGTAGAYNTGVATSAGEWIVMCSADDLLLPAHMTEMSAAIEDAPGPDIWSSNGYFLRGDGSTIVYGPEFIRGGMDLLQLIGDCFFGVGATYRREVFDRIGGYRTGIYAEDYDFWLRALARGATHGYLDTPLSVHRLGETQKSADKERLLRSGIRIRAELAESGLLSKAEIAAIQASIHERRLRIARLEPDRRRRALRVAMTRLSDPVSLARDVKQRLSDPVSLARAVKRRSAKAVRGLSRRIRRRLRSAAEKRAEVRSRADRAE